MKNLQEHIASLEKISSRIFLQLSILVSIGLKIQDSEKLSDTIFSKGAKGDE